MEQAEQDSIDARRWRAVRKRYASALCRLATDSTSYSSAKAPALLDAWADMAAAEVEAFDPEKWMREEVPARIAELKRSGAKTMPADAELTGACAPKHEDK